MKTAPTMNHPDQPTGNAFDAAVAKILGRTHDGYQSTWVVPTDLGDLQVGVTVDDAIGMQFLGDDAIGKIDEIGASLTGKWNITRKDFPDSAAILRELVKRLARVGFVPAE